MPTPYPHRHTDPKPELRERAVRMVAEVAPDYPSQWAAITDPQGAR
jgi:hypothetical protein